MKSRLSFIMALALVSPLIACGNGNGSGPGGPNGTSVADFAGNWTATTALFSSLSGGDSQELIAEGATLSFVISASGSVTFVQTFGDEGLESEAGTLSLPATGEISLSFPGDDPVTGSFSFSMNGGVLTLELSGLTFDFGGGEEPVTLRLVLRNQEAEIALIAGSWNASSLTFSPLQGGGDPVDLIAEGGTLTLVVTGTGGLTLTTEFPGDAPEVETGQVVVFSATQLKLAFSEGEGFLANYSFSNSNNTLTLTSNDEEFDFSGDDQDEPASLTVVLERT